MRLVPWLPILATLGGLPCAAQSFDHCGQDPKKCAEHKMTFQRVDWPTCPVRALLDDEALPEILELERLHRHFPVDPNAITACALNALMTLREARDAADAHAYRISRMGDGHD